MSKGKLFVISGPSGCGKDTIMQRVFQNLPELKFSISSVTRPMRAGEKKGEKYHFVSREEFEKMIADDKLLEYNCFVGNYYGTPIDPVKECISKGEDMLIEVDVNGAANIRAKLPEAVSIFIMPPSVETLEERLRARATESEDVLQKRIAAAKGEIERASEFNYVVINDDLDTAVREVVEIIKQKR